VDPQETSFRGKILVIRGGAIGDFILTLPAIAALRLHFPQAHLEVLGYPHIVQLATAACLVDRVQQIEARPLAAFFARGGDLPPDLIDYFSEFDLIVSYLYDPDEIFEINVRRCTPAQFIAGPYRPDERAELHATKVFLQPLERLAIFDANPVPHLPLAANGPVCHELAAHPGSGSERKNWPEDRWAELLRLHLQPCNSSLLLVGGEAETGRLHRLANLLPPSKVRIAQSLPLAELGARLQSCSAFIGHDSGITHLAAALGLPGLVLWADTNPEIWRPLSEAFTLLRHPLGLDQLSVAEVAGHLPKLIRLPVETSKASAPG
jgi:heptosyltransferase III